VFAGAFFDSALIAFGVWNIASSTGPWPSGVRRVWDSSMWCGLAAAAPEEPPGCSRHPCHTLLGHPALALLAKYAKT
jgi:hypothetical protein